MAPRACSLIAVALWAALCGAAPGSSLRPVPGGDLTLFLKPKAGAPRTAHVNAFAMDRYPVTQSEFQKFVSAHPEWRKSKVKSLFADAHYLQNWPSDLDFGAQNPDSPVTYVSWYAANEFCQAAGKRLATTDQWEYAAGDLGRNQAQTTKVILDWYSEPNATLGAVGRKNPNGFGINDLFGLIWEWTEDFGDPSGDSAGSGGGQDDNKFVCGGAGSAAINPQDYATYMRYSFRSSLKAKYAQANLGFRCAGEKP